MRYYNPMTAGRYHSFGFGSFGFGTESEPTLKRRRIEYPRLIHPDSDPDSGSDSDTILTADPDPLQRFTPETADM